MTLKVQFWHIDIKAVSNYQVQYFYLTHVHFFDEIKLIFYPPVLGKNKLKKLSLLAELGFFQNGMTRKNFES